MAALSRFCSFPWKLCQSIWLLAEDLVHVFNVKRLHWNQLQRFDHGQRALLVFQEVRSSQVGQVGRLVEYVGSGLTSREAAALERLLKKTLAGMARATPTNGDQDEGNQKDG